MYTHYCDKTPQEVTVEAPSGDNYEHYREDENAQDREEASTFDLVMEILWSVLVVIAVIVGFKILCFTITIPSVPREDQYFVDYLEEYHQHY